MAKRRIPFPPSDRANLLAGTPHTRRKWPTDAETSERMKRVKQSGTGPERRVRSVLRENGVRFKANVRSLPGTPDFCHKSSKWAILVHGCFWHGHRGCKRATIPTRNRRAWLQKIKRNTMRDLDVVKKLRREGYAVLVVWECETFDSELLQRRLRRFVPR